MNIELVKTATKIGDFVLNNDNSSPNHIKVQYSPNVSRNLLSDNKGRVYLFVVDKIIKKIGGSSSTGGIKSTLSFYASSMTGSPGKPRFILHLLIRDELLKKKKVEIYMIQSEFARASVNGLFDSEIMNIAAFKEMEDRCRNDYYSVHQKHPDWNFKENNIPYPNDYSLEHVKYHERRLARIQNQ